MNWQKLTEEAIEKLYIDGSLVLLSLELEEGWHTILGYVSDNDYNETVIRNTELEVDDSFDITDYEYYCIVDKPV